jgi:hypothetical protein
MMSQSKTAAPIAVGNGGDSSKAVAAGNYRTSTQGATEFASLIIAARYRLTPCMARVVCELAQIGGRLA